MRVISILGCGWLGFDLAKNLLKTSLYTVKGSTSTKQKMPVLKENGIIPYLIDIKEKASFDGILDCDVLLISIPPKEEKAYLNFLNQLCLHKNISQLKQIILISSTSVYPNEGKEFAEDEFINEQNSSKKVVFQAHINSVFHRL